MCWREATLEPASSPSSLMGSGGVRTEDGRAEGCEVLLYGLQAVINSLQRFKIE